MADAIELLRLGEGPLAVQAGERIEVRLQVTNRRPVVDQFETRVEGLPPDWSSPAATSVSLFPGEQGTLAVTLHPPGGAETRAGRYPLRLGVISRDDPSLSSWLPCDVEVVPLGGVSAELRPELVEGRRGVFRVIVTNFANHPRRVALRGSDPAQELFYRFERSEAELEPQEERSLPVEVVPPRRPFVGSPLEHAFAVEAFDPEQPDAPPLAQLGGTYRYRPVLAQWPWARLPLWGQRALPFLALALAALTLLFATHQVLAALGVDLALFAAASPSADQTPSAATPAPTATQAPAAANRPTPATSGGAGAPVAPLPASPPLVRGFDLQLAKDAPRGTSALTWHVEAADAVQLNGQPLAPAGSAPPGEGGQYLLEATSAGGTTQRALVLQVVGPPIIKQFMPAAPVIGAGEKTELIWQITGADAAEIEGAPLDLSTDRLEIQPEQSASYILTARNAAGQVSSYVAVTVVPDPALTLSVAPEAIEVGGKAELAWTSSHVSGLRIDPDIGAVRPNGSRGVAPKETTTYQLTGKNALGKEGVVSVTLQVNALPPPVVGSFAASPSSITRGGATTLTWDVTGARSVTIQPGIGGVAASGSRRVNPQSSTTYSLVATNEGGSVSAQVAVGVGEVPPPAISRFSASPATITVGDRVTLSWATSGASTRTIAWEDSGGKHTVAANPESGTTTVQPVLKDATTLSFTLTSTGATGQTATASDKVAAVQPVSIQRFVASAPDCAGASSGPQRITLTWAASGGSDATVQIQRGSTTVFNGTAKDLSGSYAERPPIPARTSFASHTYTLTIRNAAGSAATRSTSATVGNC